MKAIDQEEIKRKVLPYFIEVYGEEYRDLVIERMKSFDIIFYSTTEGYESILQIRRIELTCEFLKRHGIVLSETTKTEVYAKSSIILEQITAAKKLLSLCFGTNQYIENMPRPLQKIVRTPSNNRQAIFYSAALLRKLNVFVGIKDYNEWLSSEEASKACKLIDELLEEINQLDKEFLSFQESIKEYTLEKKDINKIVEKYMLEFLISVQEYLCDSDIKLLDNYLASKNQGFQIFIEQLSFFKFVSTNIFERSILESFSSDACFLLSKDSTPLDVIEIIKQERREYYNLMGLFPVPENSDSFYTDSKYHPNKYDVDDILQKREEYANLIQDEILKQTTTFSEDKRRLEELNYLDSEIIEADLYDELVLFYRSGMRIKNGQIKHAGLIFYSPLSCQPGAMDVSFIHEINHALESTILKYKNGIAYYKSGYELTYSSITDESDIILPAGLNEPVTESNEVMNNMIAIEVTKLMHKDGVYLFDLPSIGKESNCTIYEHQELLVSDLWKSYRYLIIRSRLMNSLDPLLNVIGHRNFDRLNHIINEYSRLPHNEIKDSIVLGIDSEEVKKSANLIKSALDIYSDIFQNTPTYKEKANKLIFDNTF